MDYVIYLLRFIYFRYIDHIIYMNYIISPHLGLSCIPYILYSIYSLYYTMDYVIYLLSTYIIY